MFLWRTNRNVIKFALNYVKSMNGYVRRILLGYMVTV